ncbi:uncharacterized protein VSU04_008424 isoform 2-T2 [Chlamydotis macqueenii]
MSSETDFLKSALESNLRHTTRGRQEGEFSMPGQSRALCRTPSSMSHPCFSSGPHLLNLSQRSHRSVSAALGLLMFGRQPQLRAGAPMEAVLSLRLSWIHCPVPGRKPATFRASVSRMPHQDAGRVVFCSGQRRESYQD